MIFWGEILLIIALQQNKCLGESTNESSRSTQLQKYFGLTPFRNDPRSTENVADFSAQKLPVLCDSSAYIVKANSHYSNQSRFETRCLFLKSIIVIWCYPRSGARDHWCHIQRCAAGVSLTSLGTDAARWHDMNQVSYVSLLMIVVSIAVFVSIHQIPLNINVVRNYEYNINVLSIVSIAIKTLRN